MSLPCIYHVFGNCFSSRLDEQEQEGEADEAEDDEEEEDFYFNNDIIEVLSWWLKSGLEMKYDSHIVDIALKSGRIDILSWWLKSGLEIKYTDEALNRAHVDCLKVWEESHFTLKESL